MDSRMVRIEFEGLSLFRMRLRDDRTETLRVFLQSLPFESVSERWGEEVYFSAPFHAPLEEDARAEMEIGDVAFWPQGDAMAIFFGRTPSSTDDKPRAYSPCNIVGIIEGDLSGLKRIRGGLKVRLSSE